ncbi:ArpU family phage packaging/lysis transcriptional regulator [Metabacillus fastidiosus]|uniref:ArpU family phage packaging/lysis transcriptional regulator n=1 Tax=Metabacillus fastidiosus TaxID=1458 RepID=UPI002E1FF36F|nr:ArpU family phage packaging/lysis transcriptional regulator [Metabacillus fastidiosus]MED4530928.1 ArpU family phage packaging/lysis transcriptional regulator [Metabacillus fastidiosus]
MRNRYTDLPKINEKATKKELEKMLFKYRDYLISLPIYLMPKITASYSIVPPSNTNAFHSSTEDAAIERIEYEKLRDDYLKEIHDVINTLKDQERHIIIERYLRQDELGYDREIWMNMGVGKTKYYEIKGEAMLRLAFALKVEVYQKSEAKAG